MDGGIDEMKRLRCVIFLLVLLSILAACGNGNIKENVTDRESDTVLGQDWSGIEAAAKGTEVRIFMWGGDDGINQYMDEWVAPRLKEQYGVTLTRTPMDTGDILNKLLTEKQANKETGTIDIIWVNGENFKNAKENNLLLGSFASKLPNYNTYVDTESLDINYDFGTPVDGLEAPWGKVQFVFLYDSAKVANPPSTFTELKEWVEANPNKFTYPNATDFTGNAFLRHVLYESVGGPQRLLEKGYDEEFVDANSEEMWTYLNDIKPYLWREGETYPESLAQLDQLYSRGEVWFSMGYNEARAESLIKNGTFPETTKTFVMESGSIGNTHFLTVPFNGPNSAGAMVAINFMLSPEAQLAKMEPTMWGENMVLDPDKLSAEHKKQLAEIDRGASVLSSQGLKEALLPEVDAQYVNWIKEKWLSEVVQP
jgi:putative spermidine/putrescine transport system substrate-binding protein